MPRFRPVILLVTAVGIAVFTSACSTTNSMKGATPISTQPTTVTPDPLDAPVEPLPKLMKEAVEVVRPPGKFFRMPPYSRPTQIGSWMLRARSEDDRFLLVDAPYDPCAGPPVAINITETDHSVTIVPLDEPPPAGMICAASTAVIGLLVDLSSPLGARELLHPEVAFSDKGA
jgi:hypothetical protein